jgi:hypothetical protein
MSGFILVSALTVMSPGVAPPQHAAWEVIVSLGDTEVGPSTDRMKARGYRPVGISAYNSVEANRFAVIFQKSSGPAWEMNWGLTPDQFVRRARVLRARGYGPACLSGCNEIGAQRLSYLWDKRAGIDRDWSYGLEAPGLLDQIGRMRALGYRPARISSFMANAANVYAVVWEKRDVAWELKYDLSAQQLQDAMDDLLTRGYRPVSIGGLNAGGVVRYCAVWEKRTGPAWEVRFGQSQGAFLEYVRSMAARGYRPVTVTGYNTLQGDRFASIWQKE